MPAWQSMDETLFRFLNQKLANPVFDVLMPFLSGNALFVPAVVVVVLLVLWRGGCKGRVYVLMVAVLLGLGDPFVCNPLKHYFERPRPYIALADARRPGADRMAPAADAEVVAKSRNPRRGLNSMPSAHAFNWGALALITFIYYRRSWRFMVPLALAVAFSRIYNGVHYPSDVLVGLLLGATYAFSGVVALSVLWHWLGKRLFPLWQARLPNLAAPELQPAPTAEVATRDGQWLRLGCLLIAAIFFARLAYLASGTILLSEDEAYQWLWSKHLALSYYSKPFGIALAQWVGTHLWGDTAFGVRFLSPVLAAILGVVLLRFVARHTDGRTGFWFVAICAVVPLIAVGAILMTVDPLTVFFWTLAMLAGWRGISEDSTRWWIACGLGMGAAFLCKYVSPFQWASFALFFLLYPPARARLRRPGPWLAMGINLLATLPVIIWNAQNQWITFTHLSERGGLEKKWVPTLKYFGEFVGAQLGLFNIVFAVAILWAAALFVRRDLKLRSAMTARQSLELFLLCQGIVVLGFYTLYTFKTRVLPNWIAASVVPLLLFATLWWHRQWQAGHRAPKWFIALGLALGIPLIICGYNTDLIEKPVMALAKRFPKLNPGRMDPLHRLRGADQMAAIVQAKRAELLQEGKPVFIIADHYGRAGLLSFYLPEAKALVTGEALVTVHRGEVPKSQLWFWPGYDYKLRTGQNAIFLDEDDEPEPPPEWLVEEFESVTDLGMFDVNYHGRNYNRFQLFVCRGKK